MHFRAVEYALWAAAPLLQLGTGAALYRRGLHRDYPYFVAYLLLQILATPLLVTALVESYPVYFYSYYVTLALSLLLSFGVLRDIPNNAVAEDDHARSLIGILIPGGMAVILAATVFSVRPASDNGHLADAFMDLDRVMRLIQCAIVMLLLLFRARLGVSMRSIPFGIALGFGAFAMSSLTALSAARSGPLLRQSTVSLVNSASYVGACVVWFLYAVKGVIGKRSPGTIGTSWEPSQQLP